MLRFVTLGTSAAVPTLRRGVSAHLLQFEGENILFDCGEGTQLALMKQHLGMHNISQIYISHWHADHFTGLIGLLQTMGLEGRIAPLTIRGPVGTRETMANLMNSGYGKTDYHINVEELKPQQVLKFQNEHGSRYQIQTYKTRHVIDSLGYVFKEYPSKQINKQKMRELGLQASPAMGRIKRGESVNIKGKTIRPEDVLSDVPGRKIVYTGDTAYCEQTIRAAQGADLLVHDATFSEETKKPEYGHTSAKETAQIAFETKVKRLVLVHIGRKFDRTPEILENEAKEIFEFSEVAEDGSIYEIPKQRPDMI